MAARRRVAAVGVLADEGTDAAALAARVRDHLPGLDVRTYTGTARGDVEYLDAGAAAAN